MKKIGLVSTGLLFVVVILVLSMRGCSIRKKSSMLSSETSSSSENKKNSSTKNIKKETEARRVSSNNSEDTSSFNEDEVPMEEKNKSDVLETDILVESTNAKDKGNTLSEEDLNNSIKDVEIVADKTDILKEESDATILVPASKVDMVSKKSGDALVSAREVFIVGSKSYVYCIKLILSVEGSFEIVPYFCSMKTYEAVSVGDSLVVEYGLGSSGYISVFAVSRGVKE